MFTMPYQSGIALYIENEGDEKSGHGFSQPGNLGLPIFSQNYHSSRYLPGTINLEVDWEARNLKDTSEWKLCTEVFKMICQTRRTLDIDIFASRISHQLPQYMSWKLDPFSRGQVAFQINWSRTFTCAFPLSL